jgi:hypothetical protein
MHAWKVFPYCINIRGVGIQALGTTRNAVDRHTSNGSARPQWDTHKTCDYGLFLVREKKLLLEMLPNVGEMVDHGFCLAGRAEAGVETSSSSRYYHRRRWRLSHSISCQMGKKIVRLT